MRPAAIITSLVFLGFHQLSRAWVLDASCQTTAYQQFVVDSMAQAFTMARQAQMALTAIAPANRQPAIPLTGSFTPGQTNAFRDTFGYLFQFVNDATDPEKDLVYPRLQDQFPKAYSFDTGAPTLRGRGQYGGLAQNDLVVYCNYDRFINRPDGDVEDQDLGGFERIFTPDSSFARCRDLSINYFGTQAWTRANAINVQQIQFCKTTLQAYTGNVRRRFLNWRNESANTFIARIVDPLPELGVRTRMDTVTLADTILLHELTHTAPNGRSATNDLPRGKSYGWRNCRKINTVSLCVDNADNYALFGLAANLISRSPHVRPSPDGGLGTIR